MVLIDLAYALKLAPKQMSLCGFILLNSEQCSVNAKCGAAKIYGLRLVFSNSNLSSHTSPPALCLILWVSMVCCKLVKSLSPLLDSVYPCLRLCLCLNSIFLPLLSFLSLLDHRSFIGFY